MAGWAENNRWAGVDNQHEHAVEAEAGACRSEGAGEASHLEVGGRGQALWVEGGTRYRMAP